MKGNLFKAIRRFHKNEASIKEQCQHKPTVVENALQNQEDEVSGYQEAPTFKTLEEALQDVDERQCAKLSFDAGNTFISENMVVEGTITSTCDVEVGGLVKGPITTDGNLRIQGKVVGDVRGKNVFLKGCAIKGNVFAEEILEIDAEAVVLGNLQAKNIAMSPGAKLNGKVTILTDDQEVISG